MRILFLFAVLLFLMAPAPAAVAQPHCHALCSAPHHSYDDCMAQCVSESRQSEDRYRHDDRYEHDDHRRWHDE